MIFSPERRGSSKERKWVDDLDFMLGQAHVQQNEDDLGREQGGAGHVVLDMPHDPGSPG